MDVRFWVVGRATKGGPLFRSSMGNGTIDQRFRAHSAFPGAGTIVSVNCCPSAGVRYGQLCTGNIVTCATLFQKRENRRVQLPKKANILATAGVDLEAMVTNLDNLGAQ
jgi:hypothetical protein